MQCLKKCQDLTPGTDTICSLIQPLCNTVYTSNKGLDEPTRHGTLSGDAVEPVNAGERL